MFGERASSRGDETKEEVRIHAVGGDHAGGAQNKGDAMSDAEIVRGESALNCAVVSRDTKLLLADDDPSILELMSRILSFLGYEVTVASNGLEAGTLFLTGCYDLVITDLHMPLMDGWQLSRLIKERSPTTPVIVITGGCEDRNWEEMNMNWVDAIVMKPLKAKEISRTIQSLLRVA